MAWARIDDGFDDHPKVLSLGNNLVAIGLWTVALTYACRNAKTAKRPGLVPREFLGRYGADDGIAMALAMAKLWEPCDEGWIIHDFETYLPAAKTSAELSAKRAMAGRKGAEARWGKRKAAVQEPSDGMPDSSTDGKPMRLPFLPSTCHGTDATNPDGKAMGAMPCDEVNDAGHSLVDGKLPLANMANMANDAPEPLKDKNNPPLTTFGPPVGASTEAPDAGVDVVAGAGAKIGEAKVAKRSGRSPRVASRIDPDFQPTEKLRAWFVEGQFGKLIDGKLQHEKFVDYWLADNTPKAMKRDWDAAWRYWMRNAYEYALARGGKPAMANGTPVSSKTASAIGVMQARDRIKAKQLALGG
jgi:hypothetical protein